MSDTTVERKPGYKTYLIVYAALVCLTAITVTSASLDIGRVAIVIVLAIAGTKSVLVLLYFMHLRTRSGCLIKDFDTYRGSHAGDLHRADVYGYPVQVGANMEATTIGAVDESLYYIAAFAFLLFFGIVFFWSISR